jgi:hypothetical protein
MRVPCANDLQHVARFFENAATFGRPCPLQVLRGFDILLAPKIKPQNARLERCLRPFMPDEPTYQVQIQRIAFAALSLRVEPKPPLRLQSQVFGPGSPVVDPKVS